MHAFRIYSINSGFNTGKGEGSILRGWRAWARGFGMDGFRIGFVGFGEVNTPREVIERKCTQALEEIRKLDAQVIHTSPVADNEDYADADRAVRELSGQRLDMLVVCVAGWIPTHAVIRVIDHFRHVPMLLWGLCGWMENGKLVSTADQAGTTALNYAMKAMHYKFRYVYSVLGSEAPAGIKSFANACYAASKLRDARVGTMGYRDMLLYGTMFDGPSLRCRIGVEVEPFEMLEIAQKAQTIPEEEIAKGVAFVRESFIFTAECPDKPIAQAVRYALAIAERVRRRRYDAVSLIDVDGMKKLLGIPPSMIFLLLDLYCGVSTIPENDILGSVTQLMVRYATGQIAAYGEFYEFFENSFLMGVPDYIPREVTLGDALIRPSTFGLLSTSLLNVSKYKDGPLTMARLVCLDGKYTLHLLRGHAVQPPAWEECGWAPPAPQLPSLEVTPECPMEEFAQKVSSQHIIIAYGDHLDALKQLCYLLEIECI